MSRQIYGSTSIPKPCVYTPPPGTDINLYLKPLGQTLASLSKYNSKQAAIENIQIIEANLAAALANYPQ